MLILFTFFYISTHSSVILNPSTPCIWTDEMLIQPHSPLGSVTLEFVPRAVTLAELLTE